MDSLMKKADKIATAGHILFSRMENAKQHTPEQSIAVHAKIEELELLLDELRTEYHLRIYGV